MKSHGVVVLLTVALASQETETDAETNPGALQPAGKPQKVPECEVGERKPRPRAVVRLKNGYLKEDKDYWGFVEKAQQYNPKLWKTMFGADRNGHKELKAGYTEALAKAKGESFEEKKKSFREDSHKKWKAENVLASMLISYYTQWECSLPNGIPTNKRECII